MESVQEWLEEGVRLHQSGQWGRAEVIYRRILNIHPHSPETLDLLGMVAQQTGRGELAVDLIGQAIALEGDVAVFHHHQGLAWRVLGRNDLAVQCYRQALALDANDPDTYFNLGNAYRGLGRLEEAAASFAKSLELRPAAADGCYNLGLVLQESGRWQEAAKWYEQALKLQPNYAEAHNNLGAVLEQLQQAELALVHCQAATTLKPSDPAVWMNYGNVLQNLDHHQESAEAYRNALALDPGSAEAVNNLGTVLQHQGQLDGAADCYQTAVALAPDFAEAQLNLATIWLLAGDFSRGWPQWQWRRRGRDFGSPDREFSQPLWNGESRPGQIVLLYAEQGMGDTIQFARYLPMAAARGARIVLECQPPLKRLMQTVEGVDAVYAKGEALPAFDCQAPLLSLPQIFATTIETIPARVPYLRSAPPSGAPIAADGRFKVGFAWAGNPEHKNDRRRSLNPEHLAPLLAIKDVACYSLQHGGCPASTSVSAGEPPIVDLAPWMEDFAALAGLIEQLDLVITIDTSVAHLAGALGKSVWVLLPFAPDWRWLQDREESPWYPSMRLFRQPAPENWSVPIARIQQALLERVAGHNRGCTQGAVGQAQFGGGAEFEQWGAAFAQARALKATGRLTEAAATYQAILKAKPDFPEAHLNLGNLRKDLGDAAGALQAYRRALVLRPGFAAAHNSLGAVLMDEGRFQEAAAACQTAGRLQPDFPEAHNNLGKAWQGLGRLVEARAAYQAAIRLRPDFPEAHYNRGLLFLLEGNYQDAWQDHEWRWQCPGIGLPRRRWTQPPWQGEALGGRTILLQVEQGLGDVLQFIRYAPLVAGRGGRVVVECHAPLKRLLQSLPGIEQVVAFGEALPPFDLWVPLLGLPRIFGTTLDTIPVGPYLRAPEAMRLPPNSDSNAALKVGLVWAGSPRPNRHRSVTLAQMAPLLRIPGIAFYSLQVGEAAAELRNLSPGFNMVDLSPCLNDVADTAAAIAALDLVISVDTSVAHLAGALGHRVWTLLLHVPDWRWLLDREDSPWYPTMRLFRQPHPGDWGSAIQHVARALAAWRDGAASERQAQRAERKMPERVADLQRRGLAYRQQGQFREAIACFRESVVLEPQCAPAYFNLGLALQETGQRDQAIECYQAALQHNPADIRALLNLGVAWAAAGCHLEAAECYQRVLVSQPDCPEALNNLGSLHQASGSLPPAIACYRSAVRTKPDYVDAQVNLAIALREAGQFEEACSCHRAAIARQPDYPEAHSSLAFTLLLSGRFAEGWEEYEWRRKTRALRSCQRQFSQPLWRGEPIHGKTVLLHTEQGMGDILQFIRYGQGLANRGARVIVECPNALRSVVATAPGISQVVSMGDPLPAFEFQVPLLSLPRIFATTLSSIPSDCPYLASERPFDLPGPPNADGRVRVGLVWAGNPRHQNDRQRSIPLSILAPVVELQNVVFYSLQVGPRAAELKTAEFSHVIDLSPQLHDFADTAAAMARLDLVIAVDTAVAHLAGALGTPVWTLLPHAPDWRWLLERETSPWYPGMRLFRQRAAGDWPGVIERVAVALRDGGARAFRQEPPTAAPGTSEIRKESGGTHVD